MSSLKNTFIADKYTSLLHADGQTLSAITPITIFDGAGNKTSLSIASENGGICVTGTLTASNVGYPSISPAKHDIIVAESVDRLVFKSLSELLGDLGGLAKDGVYEDPTITFQDGIIVDIVSNARGGLQAYDTSGTYVFTVPDNVRKMKFFATGGGGGGGGTALGNACGGAGGTVIGYMTTTPGTSIRVKIGGKGVGDTSPTGGSTFIKNSTNDVLVEAFGGNTSTVINQLGDTVNYGGGYGEVSSNQVITSFAIIRGGDGGIDVHDTDSESIGASSYWGNGAAPGGGQGGINGHPLGTAGDGYVLFEW